MGYTHYWKQKRSFTDNEWDTIQRCVKMVIASEEKKGIVLRSWDGTGKPEVTSEYVSFNGNEDTGDDHETFRVDKNQPKKESWVSEKDYKNEGAFVFCKTARKPYDSAVVMALVVIQEIAPTAIDISSDGDDDVFKIPFSRSVANVIKAYKEGRSAPPAATSSPEEFTARFSMLDLD